MHVLTEKSVIDAKPLKEHVQDTNFRQVEVWMVERERTLRGRIVHTDPHKLNSPFEQLDRRVK